jgi:hypothetical protein
MQIKFLSENPKGRNYFENVGVEIRIILEWVLKKEVGKLDRLHLPQDRLQWEVPVNTVMNFQFRKQEEDFLIR